MDPKNKGYKGTVLYKEWHLQSDWMFFMYFILLLLFIYADNLIFE